MWAKTISLLAFLPLSQAGRRYTSLALNRKKKFYLNFFKILLLMIKYFLGSPVGRIQKTENYKEENLQITYNYSTIQISTDDALMHFPETHTHPSIYITCIYNTCSVSFSLNTTSWANFLVITYSSSKMEGPRQLKLGCDSLLILKVNLWVTLLLRATDSQSLAFVWKKTED